MISKEYFSARYIIEDYKTVHKNTVLIVNGNYIENIVPIETITKNSDNINELGDVIISPGFTNAHSHVALNSVKDDYTLFIWTASTKRFLNIILDSIGIDRSLFK